MLKLSTILLVSFCITVINSLIFKPRLLVGGYTELQDYSREPRITIWVNEAAALYGDQQNFVLEDLAINKVERQQVAGENYRIGFEGMLSDSDLGIKAVCVVIIHLPLRGEAKINMPQCNIY